MVKKRPSSFEPINGFINVIKLIEPFESKVWSMRMYLLKFYIN